MDAENASRDNNTANNAPELGIDKGKAKQTAQDEEEIPPRDLEEMERIYDMLAEEYHDSPSSLSSPTIPCLDPANSPFSPQSSPNCP